MDESQLLERLIMLMTEHNIRYCVIGGQGVNAYVTPLVSLDLDLVIAVDQLAAAESMLGQAFTVRHFPHSINISLPNSELRVQIQTDERYFDFVERASMQEVLGLSLPVAHVADLLQGKIWAFQDAERRASKRQKDLTDIARLLEEYPDLVSQVPVEIRQRLVL
ncbi:MAG: nucleotidyl transferase AbiEii/AbiGii toxin family protein [Caldilineaceae bacterium]|nr:nucleotidyl transferase AbiEii/AbiGii toxin family protein [Caldilineaceae bacterium]MCB9156203.1 nucleotidyl transferase AbiEii/AbiGii toxin family protein [Caldilineaceae bacterium]